MEALLEGLDFAYPGGEKSCSAQGAVKHKGMGGAIKKHCTKQNQFRIVVREAVGLWEGLACRGYCNRCIGCAQSRDMMWNQREVKEGQ